MGLAESPISKLGLSAVGTHPSIRRLDVKTFSELSVAVRKTSVLKILLDLSNC